MNYEKYVDRLFDDNNFEPVVIKDNDGKDVEFDQVAVVDFEGSYYAVLAPITKLEGVGEDEVLIFKIDEEKDQLVFLEDEKIADSIIDLLAEEEDEE